VKTQLQAQTDMHAQMKTQAEMQAIMQQQMQEQMQSFKRELLSALKKQEWRHASKNPKLCLCYKCVDALLFVDTLWCFCVLKLLYIGGNFYVVLYCLMDILSSL